MKSLVDPRAVLLALVLAVAAALPFMTTSLIRRDYYFFDVTLTSTSPGTTQVFWDLGRGFGEYDSSRQPLKIEPKPVVYRFMLPMGEIKALRFDPIDGVGTFTFSHARVVDYRGRSVREFSPEDFQAGREIARLDRYPDSVTVGTTPDSRDPILFLKMPGPLHLSSNARIWLELGWPVAWKVFLAGLLVGLGPVARTLTRGAQAAGAALARRPYAAIALAGAAAVAVQCHPVLFLGRSFASPNNGSLMLYGDLPTLPGNTEYMYTNTMSSDVGALLFQHLYYPMVQHDALLHGELPLWNRYSLGGEPLLGQGQSMFGDPFNFLTIFADSAAWAWDVRFLLAHWLLAAGLGFIVWRLTRHLGAALLTALAGAFIGFFTFRLIHPANFSVCYAPWILLAWTGLIQAATTRRQTAWLAGLVAANWTVMTSGTMKEAYMLIACLNLAGICLLALVPAAAGRRARVLGLAAAAGAGFVLLSAPGWMSFLVSWKHSFTGYDAPHAVTLPAAQLVGLFDDLFYRQTHPEENVVAPALNFLFLLGALWWLVQPRLWRSDRAGRALALAAILPLAFAFGLVPNAVILKIPFIANIGHVGNTFSCVLLTLVAVLAGCGFSDAIRRAGEPGWWGTFGRLVGVGVALAAGYFVSTTGQAKSPFFAGYAAALAVAALVVPVGVRWAASAPVRPGVLWVALALGLPLLLWRHCQFGGTFFNYYAFVPGIRTDLHAPSPAVALANSRQTGPGRVVGWGNNLFPSYNTTLRWESLYGVDAVRNRYYHELAIDFGLQRVWNWDYYTDEKDAPLLVPGHDLLNVTQYVATHSEAPRAIAGLELIGQRDLDVYRSPTAWPRAFFTDRLARYTTPGELAALVRTGDRQPFAAIQAGEPVPAPLAANLDGRAIRAATNYRFTPNTTAFTLEAPGPGVAVLTEAYYPEDFQVRLNGAPAAYFRVNHAFKGVVLPKAGRYEVSFAYWPQHFTAALWLCLAGAAGLALGAVRLWRSPGSPATTPVGT